MGKIASNLPNDSQPWGRDIEYRIEQLEALVASNEINNAARDQRMETNLSKVSELLSNTAALKTYQAQLNGRREYVLVGTNTGVSVDTVDLVLNFSIDKVRTASFEYATDFEISTQYNLSSDLNVSWGIDSTFILKSAIFENGIQYFSVSQEYDDQTFTTANPYTRKFASRAHRNVEKLVLQPGDYELNVRLRMDNISGSSTTSTMAFSGDVLSVSIIE